MLDQAFDVLKTFDFGTPLSEVAAIEEAVIASHQKPDVQKELEQRLIAALGTDISSDAKGYVCRKLAQIGSAAAVPVLAGLLSNDAQAHLARQALERIPGPEAGTKLLDALSLLTGKLKIGVIASLGVRKDVGAISVLAKSLEDSDPAIARAAALALGTIGGSEAVRVLQEALRGKSADKTSVVDSLLSCAESLLSTGKTNDAASVYQILDDTRQPRLVRLAAVRGLLACSSQQTS
ncbi:MAG: hypothetical protein FJ267_03030 [Planctomycetes bacterium]|nr:hypothetical protein [Planctomycetota bacterium]